VGLSLVWGLAACAGGADLGDTYSLSGAPATASGTGLDTTSGGSTSGMGSSPTLPDLGTCEHDSECSISDQLCFEPQGVCVAGVCEFAPKPAGAPCNDGDACTEDDVCDGLGECMGNEIECSAPNASGGSCANGACGDLTCNTGWGNCNGDWSDGCETPLDTAQNCGGCGEPCTAGQNATADCSSGTCQRSCVAPWENCDDDWSNGCEIPTGVANQCDANGLNTATGCWTAYCGSSNANNAVNFGTWYCSGCSNCHVPSAGMCHWCSPSAGVWYPPDSCVCGSYEDLACNP
jgi:hypothetical protein